MQWIEQSAVTKEINFKKEVSVSQPLAKLQETTAFWVCIVLPQIPSEHQVKSLGRHKGQISGIALADFAF